MGSPTLSALTDERPLATRSRLVPSCHRWPHGWPQAPISPPPPNPAGTETAQPCGFPPWARLDSNQGPIDYECVPGLAAVCGWSWIWLYDQASAVSASRRFAAVSGGSVAPGVAPIRGPSAGASGSSGGRGRRCGIARFAGLALHLDSAAGALGEQHRAFGDLAVDLWRGLHEAAFADRMRLIEPGEAAVHTSKRSSCLGAHRALNEIGQQLREGLDAPILGFQGGHKRIIVGDRLRIVLELDVGQPE